MNDNLRLVKAIMSTHILDTIKDLWRNATGKAFGAIESKVIPEFLPKIRPQVPRDTIVYMLHKRVLKSVAPCFRSLMEIPGIHTDGVNAITTRYKEILASEKVKTPAELKDRTKRIVATYLGAMFSMLPAIKKDKLDLQVIIKRIFVILNKLGITMVDLGNVPFQKKLAAATLSPDLAIFLNFCLGVGEDLQYSPDEHSELFLALFKCIELEGGMPETDKRITWMSLGMQVLFCNVTVKPSEKLQRVFDAFEATKAQGKTAKVKTLLEAMEVLKTEVTEKAYTSSKAIIDFVRNSPPNVLEEELPLLLEAFQEWDAHMDMRGKLVAYLLPIVKAYIGTGESFVPEKKSYQAEGHKLTVTGSDGVAHSQSFEWLDL